MKYGEKCMKYDLYSHLFGVKNPVVLAASVPILVVAYCNCISYPVLLEVSCRPLNDTMEALKELSELDETLPVSRRVLWFTGHFHSYRCIAMGWLKGKFTAKPHIEWENLWFCVITSFPLMLHTKIIPVAKLDLSH
jgi:hypothetical protein